MITKGQIIKVQGDCKYTVHIPLFDTAGNNIDYTVENCTLSYQPGNICSYKIGDIVYVAFEKGGMSNPVIIGKLMIQADKDNVADNINAITSFYGSELKIKDKAELPAMTTIGTTNMQDLISWYQAERQKETDRTPYYAVGQTPIKTVTGYQLYGYGYDTESGTRIYYITYGGSRDLSGKALSDYCYQMLGLKDIPSSTEIDDPVYKGALSLIDDESGSVGCEGFYVLNITAGATPNTFALTLFGENQSTYDAYLDLGNLNWIIDQVNSNSGIAHSASAIIPPGYGESGSNPADIYCYGYDAVLTSEIVEAGDKAISLDASNVIHIHDNAIMDMDASGVQNYLNGKKFRYMRKEILITIDDTSGSWSSSDTWIEGTGLHGYQLNCTSVYPVDFPIKSYSTTTDKVRISGYTEKVIGGTSKLTAVNDYNIRSDAGSGSWLTICSNISTLAEFKTWLQSNPIKLYYQPQALPTDAMYFSINSANATSVQYIINGSLPDLHMQRSYDAITWSDWNAATDVQISKLPLFIRNTNSRLGETSSNYVQFKASGANNIVVGGKVKSLINDAAALPVGYCSFRALFGHADFAAHLVSVNRDLFSGLSGKIEYASMLRMFDNCVNLENVPDMSMFTSVSNYGCQYMFENCKKITEAPDLSNITMLGDSCFYSMFYNCTSLQTTPNLSATTLAETCYGYMFSGCTLLKTPPLLATPTTVASNCYTQMFFNCTELKVSTQDGTHFWTSPNDVSGCTDMFSGTQGGITTPVADTDYYYR